MRAADILNASDNVSEIACVEPHEKNELRLTVKGESYEREWITSFCNNRSDRRLLGFTEFLHRDIIMSKEEYNQLPEPTGGYD